MSAKDWAREAANYAYREGGRGVSQFDDDLRYDLGREYLQEAYDAGEMGSWTVIAYMVFQLALFLLKRYLDR